MRDTSPTMPPPAYRRSRPGWWAALPALAALSCGGGGRDSKAPATTQGSAASPSELTITWDQRLLLAATEVALPPPGITPRELPDPYSVGAGAVARFCASCHDLPSPTLHSATDWPGVVRRMWLRMDRLPAAFNVEAPTVAQRHVILEYLIRNALQVSGAVLPSGPGRSAFSQTCSRCHALPDPRQHSPADWPTVVARMLQRMDQMKVDQPSRAAVHDILAYLDRVSGSR